MISRLLLLTLLLSIHSWATAAEIPFERADQFPAEAYDLVLEKRVIWFGELHGTSEAPDLFFGLVKLVSRHHSTPSVVALEIPSTEQSTIERYLESGDETVLRSSKFFSSELKDGRTSEAQVKLLSRLRLEKKVDVCCFDSFGAATPQERDSAMARNLIECAKKFPDSKLLVLSGNIHARVTEGTSWDPKYRPAAYELSQTIDSVVSFQLSFEKGTIWALTDDGFGEKSVNGEPWDGSSPYYVKLFPKPNRGYHGAIFSRRLTGSPPWK